MEQEKPRPSVEDILKWSEDELRVIREAHTFEALLIGARAAVWDKCDVGSGAKLVYLQMKAEARLRHALLCMANVKKPEVAP